MSGKSKTLRWAVGFGGGIEDPVERVVLESGDWSFPLDFLLERNDVADHLGDKQAANSGFHGRRALPATMSSDSTTFLLPPTGSPVQESSSSGCATVRSHYLPSGSPG